MTNKQQTEARIAAAKRLAKVDSDTLFRMFYDALPKTSAAFNQLTSDITMLAQFTLEVESK